MVMPEGYYSGNRTLRWVAVCIRLKVKVNVPGSSGRPDISKDVISKGLGSQLVLVIENSNI